MMALDCDMVIGLPPGPSLSTITGIWPFGLSARYCGVLCSPLVRSMGCQLYLSPHSSSAMRARMPLDVPAAYRSIMDSSLEVAMLDEARAEDDDADHDRGDGSEQHRAGGDVLGL